MDKSNFCAEFLKRLKQILKRILSSLFPLPCSPTHALTATHMLWQVRGDTTAETVVTFCVLNVLILISFH